MSLCKHKHQDVLILDVDDPAERVYWLQCFDCGRVSQELCGARHRAVHRLVTALGFGVDWEKAYYRFAAETAAQRVAGNGVSRG